MKGFTSTTAMGKTKAICLADIIMNENEKDDCLVFTLFLETATYLGFSGKANLVDGNGW